MTDEEAATLKLGDRVVMTQGSHIIRTGTEGTVVGEKNTSFGPGPVRIRWDGAVGEGCTAAHRYERATPQHPDAVSKAFGL